MTTNTERELFEAIADRLGERPEARNFSIADSGEFETRVPVNVEVLAEWILPTVLDVWRNRQAEAVGDERGTCSWCPRPARGTAIWQGHDQREPSCGELKHGMRFEAVAARPVITDDMVLRATDAYMESATSDVDGFSFVHRNIKAALEAVFEENHQSSEQEQP